MEQLHFSPFTEVHFNLASFPGSPLASTKREPRNEANSIRDQIMPKKDMQMYLPTYHFYYVCGCGCVHVFVYYQETGNHIPAVSVSLSIAKIPPNSEAEASHHDSKLSLIGYN